MTPLGKKRNKCSTEYKNSVLHLQDYFLRVFVLSFKDYTVHVARERESRA